MSKAEQLQEAAQGLVAPIKAAETERALARFHIQKRRQERRRTLSASVGAGLAIVLAAYFWAPRSGPGATTAEQALLPTPVSGERVVHFADGSMATLLSERTVLKVLSSEDELLEIELEVGRARFDVAKNPDRLFRVLTKDLRVEVLGTAFTVSEEDGKSGVAVHRGRVAVYSGGNRHELVAGMSFEVDGQQAVLTPNAPEEEEEEPALTDPGQLEDDEEIAPKGRERRRPSKASRRRPRRAQTWRHLAEEGLFAEAYDALGGPGGEPSIEDVKGLMLAADVARLTGHPQQAARYLETMITRHQGQPQAVLAAFTLGRILERELSRPADAAQAFATARRLGPESSLAEDSLAHEVECLKLAGRAPEAAAKARLYLEQYPTGRRRDRMRGLIGKD